MDSIAPSKSARYAYDKVSRLTQATGDLNGVRREDYGYDGNGNRLLRERRLLATDEVPTESSVYTLIADSNRLASVTTGADGRQFGHDGRGNIISEARLGGTIALGSDPSGRLTSYASPHGTMSMRYSGTDERVEVAAGPDIRRFSYDESQRTIGEYGASAGDVRAEHIWLVPDVGGVEAYEPLAIAEAAVVYFVHGDNLGTPAMLTDASGAVANGFDTLPFGQRWASLAAAPTTALAFPGQLIDAVDRHYNLHRDYDPTLGRYLQADPIGLEGGHNVYGYVGGNPITEIDPMGLQTAMTPIPGAPPLPPAAIPGTPENQALGDALANLNDAFWQWSNPIVWNAINQMRAAGAGAVPHGNHSRTYPAQSSICFPDNDDHCERALTECRKKCTDD